MAEVDIQPQFGAELKVLSFNTTNTRIALLKMVFRMPSSLSMLGWLLVSHGSTIYNNSIGRGV